MNLFYKILFLSSTSILFFSFTYFGAEHMFTKYDLLIILLFFIGVIFLQSIFLYIINNFSFRFYFLAMFCSINTTSLHLIFIESIHLLPFYLEITLLIIYFLLFLFICKIFEQNITISKFFSLGVIIVFIINFSINYQIPSLNNYQSSILSTNSNQDKIIFNETPNIYFISFESLVPISIAKKNFKVFDFAYHEILEKKFYSFKNSFTVAFPSRESLNSLLAFDQKKYLSLKKENKHLYFFTGVEESPMFRIFNDNGYEITTYYDNFWFGRHKGKYIYDYIVNQSGGKFNTCAFDTGFGLHFKVSFLGYCLVPDKIKFKLASLILNKDLKKTTSIEKIMQIMEKNISKKNPQFLMAHHINPGHTGEYIYGREGDFENYLNFYKKKSKVVKKELELIIKFINDKDPNALLFVYSDHGPKLSIGIEFEDNKSFKILDSFAVYSGIYPKNKCKNFIYPLNEKRNFVTLIDGAKIIINCIKKDPLALNFDDKPYFMDSGGEIKYFNNEENIKLGYDNKNLNPKNYLYDQK